MAEPPLKRHLEYAKTHEGPACETFLRLAQLYCAHADHPTYGLLMAAAADLEKEMDALPQREFILVTPEELASVLEDVIHLVRHPDGPDSFEGRLEYSCMTDPNGGDVPPGMFALTGIVRTGNQMGQGGVILFRKRETEKREEKTDG